MLHVERMGKAGSFLLIYESAPKSRFYFYVKRVKLRV